MAAASRPAPLLPLAELVLLGLEAQKVIELRMVKLAWGGPAAQAEAYTMVAEKIGAAVEATATLLQGGGTERVIACYRERVAANHRRLSAA